MYLAKSFYTKMGDYGEFFLIVANLKRFCIFLLKFALMGFLPDITYRLYGCMCTSQQKLDTKIVFLGIQYADIILLHMLPYTAWVLDIPANMQAVPR